MKKLVLFAVTLAALVACNKENAVSTDTFVKGQKVTLTVSAPSTTKVTSELNGKAVDFKWEAGDKILVTVGTQTAEFTLKTGAGESSATFEGTMPGSGDTFDVQYPVTAPVITTQTYSSTEPIPHNMLLMKATGCTTTDPFELAAQNAVLRLNLYGTNQTVFEIDVIINSHYFTLKFSGGKELSTDSANPTPFFVVVPVGEYVFNARIHSEDPLSKAGEFTIKLAEPTSLSPSSAKEFEAGVILNMPAKEITSSPTRVKFSRGNLYYDSYEGSFNFEENQWDYHTYDGSTWGLFGWVGASGTLTGDLTKYGMSTSVESSDYGTSESEALYADWADIATLPQETGRKWKTMTGDEWSWLFAREFITEGGDRKTLYGFGRVNDVNGVIILPDIWDGSVCSGFVYIEDGTTYDSNEFSDSTEPTWSEMENAGCAFLPAAGNRFGTTTEGENEYGCYWSSSSSEMGYEYATVLNFIENDVSPSTFNSRFSGCSVRLVSVAE